MQGGTSPPGVRERPWRRLPGDPPIRVEGDRRRRARLIQGHEASPSLCTPPRRTRFSPPLRGASPRTAIPSAAVTRIGIPTGRAARKFRSPPSPLPFAASRRTARTTHPNGRGGVGNPKETDGGETAGEGGWRGMLAPGRGASLNTPAIVIRRTSAAWCDTPSTCPPRPCPQSPRHNVPHDLGTVRR